MPLLSNYLQDVAVFWAVAPYSLVEVFDVSEVLAASIIRAIASR
jgi:hypothetical protein